jgi:exodeoxyribonuclease VII large subunit
LENAFGAITIEGELSNCKISGTGHFFWTLKDSSAAIQGVMFKGSLRSMDFVPKDGMLVRVSGRISVYEARGSYQIYGEKMEQAGTGDILAMLEKRKRLLAAEGLFDEIRKKAIPRFPETVAVISSPTGAAIRDILNILKRRASSLHIIILPAPVQGTEAAPIIARRIEQVNQWKLADVIIAGRGGGSLEDLLPFSEESVVRAAAASEIPIISAVGHEIDWSLLDFAADLRAPTPSAAAELVSENYGETLRSVQSFKSTLFRTIHTRVERAALLIKPFRLDYLQQCFRSILQPRLLRFDDAKENLLDAATERTVLLRNRIEKAAYVLESANPKTIMQRGYSVVISGKTGAIIRSSSETSSGDILNIKFASDSLTAKVISDKV